MIEHEKPAFDTEAFLASAGLGRKITKLQEKKKFFSQGEAADSVFYLQSGQAKFGESGESSVLIPEISEETLADTVGTTQPMVSFFLNRFCKLGLIDYDGRIRVHKALLNVVLHDQFPDDNASKPAIIDIPRALSESEKLTTSITRFTS